MRLVPALVLVVLGVIGISAGAARGAQSGAPQESGSVGTQTLLHVERVGTTSVSGLAATTGAGGFVRAGELSPGLEEKGAGEVPGGSVVNRQMSHGHGGPFSPPVVSSSAATTGSTLVSWDGIRHRDQRLANGGNQFSLEPPDQGLCVGNGFVLESVNDALRIYTTAGTPVTGTLALNQFYGYPPELLRTNPLVFGPEPTDPSCFYDPDTQRWFHVVLTIEVDPATGAVTGANHIDVAVSQSSDPTGNWTIYKLQTTNDNSAGTGNHAQCPCLGDYPHIGADKYGFYITTNEYSFFKNKFNGGQIYAMSKRALANGAANPPVVSFDNLVLAQAGTTGFTIWPAESPGTGSYALNNGGTEYFLNSMAAEEAKNKIGFDNRLGVWGLTNTSSLDTASPNLRLTTAVVGVEQYGVPPKANQKAGPTPLADCINDTTVETPFGPGCWQFFFTKEPAHNAVEGPLDSNDTRMQQVFYAGGLLYGALDTAVTVGGTEKAGIAWFVLRPSIDTPGGNVVRTSLNAAVVNQGYLAIAGNNVTYPALAIRADGKGVMAFTLAGDDHYPTAAYAAVDAANGVGPIRIAAEGAAPQDGFSEYDAFASSGTARPRWGDYGAAAVDGANIWIASEYIGGHLCYFEEYLATGFSCTQTRTSIANWHTRISEVAP